MAPPPDQPTPPPALPVPPPPWTREERETVYGACTTTARKPRLLDLCCGAGGASVGYHWAGFEVVGVDLDDQPHYPFTFHRGDALTFPLEGFDLIHASPPCQVFTQMSARWRGKGTRADTHQDLRTPLRQRVIAAHVPYVIENVVGAKYHMRTDLLRHGGMFGLGVHRPRRCASTLLLVGFYARRTPFPIGVDGHTPDGRITYRYRNAGNYVVGVPGSASKSLIRAAKSVEEAQVAMGIDWMPEWRELCEAIPPAYTEYVGRQLLRYLQRAEAVA